MNKLEIFNKFGRYVQRLALAGKKLVTVRELWELIKEGHITPQMIGYWLKEQGFERLGQRREGKPRTREYFLNEQGVELLKKKNRIGLRCGYTVHEDKKGQQINFYYDMQPDEQFASGSSCYIEKIGHPEQWKLAFCPLCNREDCWAHYNIEATKNVKKAKQQVIFSARKITPQGGLVRDTGEGSFSGPGALEVPDNLKGQW